MNTNNISNLKSNQYQKEKLVKKLTKRFSNQKYGSLVIIADQLLKDALQYNTVKLPHGYIAGRAGLKQANSGFKHTHTLAKDGFLTFKSGKPNYDCNEYYLNDLLLDKWVAQQLAPFLKTALLVVFTITMKTAFSRPSQESYRPYTPIKVNEYKEYPPILPIGGYRGSLSLTNLIGDKEIMQKTTILPTSSLPMHEAKTNEATNLASPEYPKRVPRENLVAINKQSDFIIVNGRAQYADPERQRQYELKKQQALIISKQTNEPLYDNSEIKYKKIFTETGELRLVKV